jgi:hypothetical protein
MKIYFAGSIRGANANKADYRLLVDKLKSYGKVLTEHVAEVDERDESGGDEEIFIRDLEWLKTSNIMVAEVTSPSLGVGYEIGKAEEHGIPILCLFNKLEGKRLSAMINGNKKLTIKRYATIGEAIEFLTNYFENTQE